MKERLFSLAILVICLVTLLTLAVTGQGPETQGMQDLGSPLPQGTSVALEVVGQIGGGTYAVAVQGNYAYIGVGPRLVILDVSDPSAPIVVGQTDVMPDVLRDIAVVGSYAYVAAGGLSVIDISTPESPLVVGYCETPGDANAVAVAGNYAYVADKGGGLRVIDVSTPESPTEVGDCYIPGGANDVTVAGPYAYVAAWGLRVVDVSTPESPTMVGYCGTPGSSEGVAVAGNYAYVTGERGLRVIDVSTPESPTEVGSWPESSTEVGSCGGGDVMVVGDYAYWGGLSIIDISTPESPTVVGSCGTPGGYALAVAGDYAYVVGGGLYVIDVSTPESPTVVGSYETPVSGAWDVAVAGNYAYIRDGGALRVIDVSTTGSLTVVGSCDTYAPRDLTVGGDYAYLVLWGLYVIDVSSPESPTVIGSCDTPGESQSVAVAGDYAYVAEHQDYPFHQPPVGGGLVIIDVSTPESPTIVGSCDTPRNASDVAVAGDCAYVVGGRNLFVIDVSTPESPAVVGSCETPGYVWRVAVSGNYAYVVGGMSMCGEVMSLFIIDVSMSGSPAVVGSCATPGHAWDVAVMGNYAYVDVVGDCPGLRIIDVSTPESPTEVISYNTPGSPQGVAVQGQHIYLADGSGGLVILRYTVAPVTPTPTPTGTPATPTPTPTPAEPKVELEVVGQLGGGIFAVAMQRNHAYIGVGPRLVILDISDPGDPVVLGKTDPLPCVVQAVAVEGNYAYVVGRGSGGLHIIDVSDPGIPTLVGSCDTPGLAFDVAVAGDYAYVAAGDEGLHVIDLSEPGSPSVVVSYDPPGPALGVVVAGSYAYVAAGDEGLRIIDVSTPRSPTEVGLYSPQGLVANGVALQGEYAYVADGRYDFSHHYGGLAVIDVSTPEFPTAVSFYGVTPGMRWASTGVVAVAGDRAYFAVEWRGAYTEWRLVIVDLSPYGYPMVYLDTGSDVYDVAAAGNFACVVDGELLSVMDASAFGYPTIVGGYSSPLVSVPNVAIAGDYVYVTHASAYEPNLLGYWGELAVIGVSTPESPVVVGGLDRPMGLFDFDPALAVNGDYAYIVASPSGSYKGEMLVIDVSTPGSPTSVGSWTAAEISPCDVAVAGGYAYIADRWASWGEGLHIIDVSTPESPTEVGSWTGHASAIETTGNYAYAAASEGLHVIDVSTPGSPVEVGFYDTPSSANGVAVAGNYAYITTAESGLRVMDVSNAAWPTEVGSCGTLGNTKGVAVAGDYAFVVSGERPYASEGELYVIDVSTPESPAVVASHAAGDRDVAVQEDYVYVAAGYGGLFILRYTVAQRTITSSYAGSPPEIDGDLSGDPHEWPAGLDELLLDMHTADDAPAYIAPWDLSGTLRSQWDEEYVYFAIHVNDDQIVYDSAPALYNDDAIQIGIDGHHDHVKDPGAGDDHQYTIRVDGLISDWMDPEDVELVRRAVRIVEGGYDVELAIPLTQLTQYGVEAGTVMGFNLQLQDDDDGGDYDDKLIWEGHDTNSSSEEYGHLIFAGVTETPTPTPTTATQTVTLTVTPGPSSTPTATGTVTPTGTPTATPEAYPVFLPLVLK